MVFGASEATALRRYTHLITIIHTQLYSPSKAATIKNKQNKEKEAK